MLSGIVAIVLGISGCLGESEQGQRSATEMTETERQSTSGQSSPSPTPETTESPTQTTFPTSETSIRLNQVQLSDEERSNIDPVRYDLLSSNKKEILDYAITGYEYKVEYPAQQGIPETDRTAGLQELINQIIDRLSQQTTAYEEENPDTPVPDYVSAVYLRYQNTVYCIDLLDGDQRYYLC
ncbi:hypothetical protein Hbl1158_04465 [Halobaculum sp. CBA1158]|uniref:hypothetical protein n=1 Tax=Halobaculum sp. CBA1158 TaxID=2904243 RepID=UPI001F44EAF3|nr:hypothetical protein [Halobaculum sp. CBA1158]UIP00620.1 hypothetical protein Hbl1158_04465 [Halobaculum sp. CBA1158]